MKKVAVSDKLARRRQNTREVEAFKDRKRTRNLIRGFTEEKG